ncbi:glycosyltransferase [Chryseobacterium sp. SN22]|uniref:glycosyltransferase n=1 Tax=Chryseobacterium sp. SN22 TaxID=2606431 RepID=UPI001E5F9B4A|nr:glycosyltransferase [Chryseobacterium sp. SN22]
MEIPKVKIIKMKVSVALCTYNGEQYLTEQLDSILNQTAAVDEVVICDDGSSDKTLQILSDYHTKYPDLFRIFQNKTNLGFIKNFEKAIRLCECPVIIISDQDDVWENNKVSETISFFEKNPQCDGVFHDLKLIDGQIIQPSYLNWKDISHKDVTSEIENHTLFEALVKKGSFILGCALAIRKEALQKYGMQDFPIAHDYYIVQKLSSKNKLGFIPASLSSYRLHPNQVYGLRYKSEKREEKKVTDTEKYFKENVWLYTKILERYKEINPGEDEKKTAIYSKFINKRDTYLKMLSFGKRKLYILKCIRHQYLDLMTTDLFRI